MTAHSPILRTVTKTAKKLGFNFVRTARHGEIWRHHRTHRTVMLGRSSNFGDSRTFQNLLHDMRRAAAAGAANS